MNNYQNKNLSNQNNSNINKNVNEMSQGQELAIFK